MKQTHSAQYYRREGSQACAATADARVCPYTGGLWVSVPACVTQTGGLAIGQESGFWTVLRGAVATMIEAA